MKTIKKTHKSFKSSKDKLNNREKIKNTNIYDKIHTLTLIKSTRTQTLSQTESIKALTQIKSIKTLIPTINIFKPHTLTKPAYHCSLSQTAVSTTIVQSAAQTNYCQSRIPKTSSPLMTKNTQTNLHIILPKHPTFYPR